MSNSDEVSGLARLTPDVVATREVSLVYRRELRLSKSVRAVLHFVAEVMRENTSRMAGTLREE